MACMPQNSCNMITRTENSRVLRLWLGFTGPPRPILNIHVGDQQISALHAHCQPYMFPWLAILLASHQHPSNPLTAVIRESRVVVPVRASCLIPNCQLKVWCAALPTPSPPVSMHPACQAAACLEGALNHMGNRNRCVCAVLPHETTCAVGWLHKILQWRCTVVQRTVGAMTLR